MTMADAIRIVESIGGLARQPARSTALAVWIHKADEDAFDHALARIRNAGITVIVTNSREMFNG